MYGHIIWLGTERDIDSLTLLIVRCDNATKSKSQYRVVFSVHPASRRHIISRMNAIMMLVTVTCMWTQQLTPLQSNLNVNRDMARKFESHHCGAFGLLPPSKSFSRQAKVHFLGNLTIISIYTIALGLKCSIYLYQKTTCRDWIASDCITVLARKQAPKRARNWMQVTPFYMSHHTKKIKPKNKGF